MSGLMQRFKAKIFGVGSSQFQFGNGSAAVNTMGVINAQVGAVGTGADTTEDTLFTYTLSKNSLSSNGKGLFLEAFGSLANNAHTKTIKLYFGSSVVLSSGGVTTANASFYAKLTVVRRASGVQTCHGLLMIGTAIVAQTTFTAGADADTSTIVLKLTGQTATAAANDVVGNGFLLRGLN